MRVNNIFTGKLDGVTPYQEYGRIGKLDKKVGSLKERKSNVNEILNQDKFFEEYFDKHYNPLISQDSALSEDNNVCQMLSSMADYLINSDESKEMNKRGQNVYVFSEDVEKRKEKRREVKNNGGELNENVLIVSKPVKPAEFKSNNIQISKKDMNSDNKEMSNILNDYNQFILTINKKIESNAARTKKYNAMKSSVLDDMKMVKQSYLGILPRSKSVPGGHFNKKTPTPDYTNMKVFKRVINTLPTKLEENYELWENSFDFLNLLKDCVNGDYITQEEMNIIILRMYGWEYREILEDLNLEYPEEENQVVHLGRSVIRQIHKKIVRYLKENSNEETK